MMKTITSISFSFVLGLLLLFSTSCNTNTAPDDGLSPFPTPSNPTSCGKMGVKINGESWVGTDFNNSALVLNTAERTLTMNIKGGDGSYVKIVAKDVVTPSGTSGIAVGEYSLVKTAAAGSNTFQIFYQSKAGETTEMAYGHLKIIDCDKLMKTVTGTFDFDDNIVNTKITGINGTFSGVCYK